LRFYVGKNIKDLRAAKRWVTDSAVPDTLRRVVEWASSREGKWGDCSVFFEVSCQRYRGEQGSQIDLLLAFGDRLAICEVKRRPLEPHELVDAAHQVDLQQKLVASRLKSFVTADRLPACLLFFPHYSLSQLLACNRHLNNEGAPHVRVAGCVADADVHKLDLSASLDQWLRMPQIRRGVSAADVVQRHLITSSLAPVKTFEILVDDLRRFAAPVSSLRQPSWHIAELRAVDRSTLLATLRSARFVEINGPELIGKSALLRDVFVHDLKLIPRQVQVREAYDSGTVLRRLYEYLIGPVRTLGEHEIIHMLIGLEHPVWISEVDTVSIVSLRQTIERLAATSRQLPPPSSAPWVIETRRLLQAETVPILILEPLGDAAVRQVVARLPEVCRDVDDVIRDARGNPGAAVLAAQSREPRLPVPSHVERDDTLDPWMVLLDLAFSHYRAGLHLWKGGFHAQAMLLASESVKKTLESLLVRWKEDGMRLSRMSTSLMERLKQVPDVEYEDMDQDHYRVTDRPEMIEFIDRLIGPSGERLHYPSGIPDRSADVAAVHPLESFQPLAVQRALCFSVAGRHALEPGRRATPDPAAHRQTLRRRRRETDDGNLQVPLGECEREVEPPR
jgi:hypothetical protein